MTNLLKFWLFFGIVTIAFDIYYYICELTLFYKGIQLILIYYLYEQSKDWFSSINYMIENSDELNTKLEGSINIIDNTLNSVIKIYRINKLSLDFSLKTIAFLLTKYIFVMRIFDIYIRYLYIFISEINKVNDDNVINEVKEDKEINKVKEINEIKNDKNDKDANEDKEVKNDKDANEDKEVKNDKDVNKDKEVNKVNDVNNNIDNIDDEYSIFYKKNN